MTTRKNDSVIASKLKEVLHPTVMYILSAILVFEVTSIQSDVKTLLEQTSVDKTEIANLKQQVDNLNKVVFMSTHHPISFETVQSANTANYLAYAGDMVFKHEEELNIKDHGPRRY